jgi:hypothetical protein
MVQPRFGSESGTLIPNLDPTILTLGGKKEERRKKKRKRNRMSLPVSRAEARAAPSGAHVAIP